MSKETSAQEHAFDETAAEELRQNIWDMEPDSTVEIHSMQHPERGPVIRVVTRFESQAFQDDEDPDSDDYVLDDWEAGRMSVWVQIRISALLAANRRKDVDEFDLFCVLWRLGFGSAVYDRQMNTYTGDEAIPFFMVKDLLAITEIMGLGPCDLVASPDQYGCWFRHGS